MEGLAVSSALAGVRSRIQGYWDARSSRQRWAGAGLVVFLLALIPVFSQSFFFLNTMVFLFLFLSMGHAWNIIGGYAGQISLGHAVMFAAGAYTTAILFVYYGITPFVGIPVGGVVAMLIGLLIGTITFPLRYHYFAMATLAAALIVRVIAFRWDFIGGATGIEYPFDQLGTLYSFTFEDKAPYYYITGGFALLVTAFMYRLDQSRLGIYLKAVNMDQELAENAGLRAFWYKMYAMGLSSLITGLAGGLYVQFVLYIDPLATLRVLRNIDIIMVPIVGGVGTVLGPVIGAFIFIPVREFTRTTLSGTSTGLGWVMFGVVLLLISIYRPGGLLNKYTGRWNE